MMLPAHQRKGNGELAICWLIGNRALVIKTVLASPADAVQEVADEIETIGGPVYMREFLFCLRQARSKRRAFANPSRR